MFDHADTVRGFDRKVLSQVDGGYYWMWGAILYNYTPSMAAIYIYMIAKELAYVGN